MTRYPLAFDYSSTAGFGMNAPWQTRAPEGRILLCAIPPEFEGPGRDYSPEDFFGLAVINCFVATFKVIAEKSRVHFEELALRGQLFVDRDEKGRPWMKAIQIDVQISPGAEGSMERIKRVFEKTTESCLVAHSIKTEVRFNLTS